MEREEGWRERRVKKRNERSRTVVRKTARRDIENTNKNCEAGVRGDQGERKGGSLRRGFGGSSSPGLPSPLFSPTQRHCAGAR